MKSMAFLALATLLLASPAWATETIWLHCNPDGAGVPADNRNVSVNIEITKNLERLYTHWGDFKLTKPSSGRYELEKADPLVEHAYFYPTNMTLRVFFGYDGKKTGLASLACFPISNPFMQ